MVEYYYDLLHLIAQDLIYVGVVCNYIFNSPNVKICCLSKLYFSELQDVEHSLSGKVGHRLSFLLKTALFVSIFVFVVSVDRVCAHRRHFSCVFKSFISCQRRPLTAQVLLTLDTTNRVQNIFLISKSIFLPFTCVTTVIVYWPLTASRTLVTFHITCRLTTWRWGGHCSPLISLNEQLTSAQKSHQLLLNPRLR